eukprot:COSAG02_NODE_693_length_18428_cov_268.516722_8_plen_331_part_00
MPAQKRQRRGSKDELAGAEASYLVQFGTALPGAAGGGLFFAGRGDRATLTRLQAAALRLAWASIHAHVSVWSPAAANLSEDIIHAVGTRLQADSLVVHDTAELRAAVDAAGMAKLIELDYLGRFELGGTQPLRIERAMRLVSGVGGQAKLVGGERASNFLLTVASAEGVTLEGLAMVPGTSRQPGGGQRQCVMEVERGGVVTARGCDLAGEVNVLGLAELHGCVVHDSDRTGVQLYDEMARVVLTSTTVERCGQYGVYAAAGVVRLEGEDNSVHACEGSAFRDMGWCIRPGDRFCYGVEAGGTGQIEGVGKELVNVHDYDAMSSYGRSLY